MKHAPLPAAAALLISLALCFAVAGLGAVITTPNVPWLDSLTKPSWAPPNSVFGPVWTGLYTMMALAGWLIWLRRDRPHARCALALFAVQLALNAAWSWIFFGLHQPGWALVELAALWLAILATAFAAWRPARGASLLLVPLLLWVAFAGALNIAIWRLN